jgi:FixJ family two-component response regulator
MLRQFGYASLLFPSAEAFANQSDFDRAICVLFDINLGDGSGIELRHRLKAAGNTVPVIYMTGTTLLPFAPLRFSPGASPISQSRSRRSR